MKKITKGSTTTINNEEVKIEQFLKTVIYLSADLVVSFFKDIGLKVPRETRVSAFKESLISKVSEIKEDRQYLGDELKYRLSRFDDFTETQLEKLLVSIGDPKIDKQFLELLWTGILSYMIEKKAKEKSFSKLLDLGFANYENGNQKIPSMKEYNKNIESLFFDNYWDLDGLVSDDLRTVLYNSSTLAEIREIGLKYGVFVPRRLKKGELEDIIIAGLKRQRKYKKKQEKEIREMPVRDLQRFGASNGIKASIDLKKDEIIEYILANVHKQKEEYFIPGKNEQGGKIKIESTIIKFFFGSFFLTILIIVFLSILFLIFPKL